jgi:hypothetical protein
LHKWFGGVLLPTGQIMGIPYNADSVLLIDPINQTVKTFGTLSSDKQKWAGGTLKRQYSGEKTVKIWCMPAKAKTVLEIDLGLTAAGAGWNDGTVPTVNQFRIDCLLSAYLNRAF